MAKNSNLTAAKKAKNDEFYTQRADIEAELRHYAEHFRDKIVYCNCDDPEESEFWKFFVRVFKPWGLKKLIATHYEPNAENYSYKIEASGEVGIDYRPVKEPLPCNGDFRSAACVELLKEADIVVTNPPFSLFREYVAQLMEYGKKFLIIGNVNAITYKEIFPYIRDNKLWLGVSIHSGDREFRIPDHYEVRSKSLRVDENGNRYIRVSGVRWYTNLDHNQRHQSLDLRGNYYKGNEDKYPKYDNYDAINVDKTADIPCDYDGVMGVPITFLDKYCPEQFEIVAFRHGDDGKDLVFTRERERKFNRTFVSLFDCDPRDNQERGRKDKWENYLRENNCSAEDVEPVDVIFPLCIKSRAAGTMNGLLNGKETYRRILVRRHFYEIL